MVGFNKAERIDRDISADNIPFKILDGIGNSRVLLFDLSDDPKSFPFKQINGNVLYELGVAMAIREKTDILLVRNKEAESEIPFNIEQLPIQEHDATLNKEWLEKKLQNVLENQEWHKSKRVKATAKLLDISGLRIMHKFYKDIIYCSTPFLSPASITVFEIGY